MIAKRKPAITMLICGLVLAASGRAQEETRPSRLAIEPNAILRGDQPLAIEIEGIPRDQRARIWVVEDCDQDGQPDDTPACQPVFEEQTEVADARGQVRHQIDFVAVEARLKEAGKGLPRGVALWLRAARPGASAFRQAIFGFVDDECSLFHTVVETFLGGRCDPGLPQVLRRHRQPSDLATTVFEVRRLSTADAEAEPTIVPGTLGASGVAWLDCRDLVVTSAGGVEHGFARAGVYRVSGVDSAGADPTGNGPAEAVPAEPMVIWQSPEEGLGAFAPIAIGKHRVAFVRQTLGPQAAGADPEVARLAVLDLRSRAVIKEIPLPYKIHQLLRVSPDGGSVLALSLGVGDNRPVLLVVDLETEGREPMIVGFANALYQSALAEPQGQHQVIAFENAFGNQGWQIALTTAAGLVRDLVKRRGVHDLAPAWHPRGGEIVYLAQRSRGR